MTGCRVLVPNGVLGSGFPVEALERSVGLNPDVIALDAGSTDSGPYYLGLGVSKMTRKAIKRDLQLLMLARDKLGVPLVIGSCGTSGTDSGVDWVADVCREIASEQGLKARLARVYCEQDIETLQLALAAGRITPLEPAGPLSEATLSSCSHVVALMGYEPLAAAIEQGADIVLAGRTTDTAVLAAVPLMRGLPAEFAWHAAKIAECGGLCTTHSRLGGVLMNIDAEGFDVEPMHADNTCTVYTVSAHLLYENSDPYRLREPGVILDATSSTYRQLDARTVRVTGTAIDRVPYTMKLEGSGPAGFRTMAFTAIADPKILDQIGLWLGRLEAHLRNGIGAILGYGEDAYQLELRPYGWNALNPTANRNDAPTPREVGLMLLVNAPTQALATEIAKYCNPYLLHYPLNADDPLPSFAFPFSPAEVEMGAVYEFKLNHVVHVDDPLALTRTELETIGEGVHAAA